MKIGYARTSTDEQTTALQLVALEKADCDVIHEDKGISGTVCNRHTLTRCLADLKAGDTLVVWKLDSVGRSVRDLLNILHDLDTNGVRFLSLTEAIETETPTARAMIHMVAC